MRCETGPRLGARLYWLFNAERRFGPGAARVLDDADAQRPGDKVVLNHRAGFTR
jgi:hypothetical protein